jgi:hypothetical protein
MFEKNSDKDASTEFIFSWTKYKMYSVNMGNGCPIWAGIPPLSAGWPGGVHLLPASPQGPMNDDSLKGDILSGLRAFVHLHDDEFDTFEYFFHGEIAHPPVSD